MGSYTKVHADWKDYPDTTTPVTAAGLEQIEQGIADAHTEHIEKTIVDAKGDLIVATAADVVARLAVGANDALLVADSAQAAGLKYAKLVNAMVDAAAAIAQSKLAFDNWQAFTPTWSGTIGNGTLTGRYVRIGNTVIGFSRVLWGSTTTHPASVQVLGLPVTALTTQQLSFFVHMVDASAGEFKGFCRANTVNDVAVFSGGEATVAGTVTNTNPMTWATSDELRINFMYEAA